MAKGRKHSELSGLHTFKRGRWESQGLPVFLGDEVFVAYAPKGSPTSRLGGRVISIEHTPLSILSRAYLATTALTRNTRAFRTPLHTVVTPAAQKKGPRRLVTPYVDDEIIVTDRGHPKYGTPGRVIGMETHGIQTSYRVVDESRFEETIALYEQVWNEIERRFAQSAENEKEFERFVALGKAEDGPNFLGQFQSPEQCQIIYEAYTRMRIAEEFAAGSGLPKKIVQAEKDSSFFVPASSIELAERSPLNDLWGQSLAEK